MKYLKNCRSFLLVGILFATISLNGQDNNMKNYTTAAEDANHLCKMQGYDSYDDFQRAGLFSAKAIAVRCKYVDNYQQMDIDLKQTYAGGLPKITK